MKVVHVLKDGTRVDDISGHIVRLSDAEPLYRLMANLYTDQVHTQKKVKEAKV